MNTRNSSTSRPAEILLAKIALVFTLTVGLTIAGCGGDKSGGKSAGAGSSDDDTERPTIAFVTNQVHSFWDIAAAGCEDAGKDLDVNIEVRFPSEATVTMQKQIVEDLITAGIDGIAISPLDAANQVNTLNQWGKSIPLICHDSDAPDSERLVFIGVDNYGAGREIGKKVKEAMPDGGNVIVCIGRLQQDNSRKRRQGVIDELLGRSVDPERFDESMDEIAGDKFKILTTLTDGGTKAQAQQKAEDSLNAFPDVNCFVGLFAYNPGACLNALKKAGRTDVIVAGFDEAEDTLQGIKDGTVICTCSQNPYQYGYKSVEVLKAIIAGDKSVIPESGYIPVAAVVVTKENVEEFEAELKARLGNR